MISDPFPHNARPSQVRPALDGSAAVAAQLPPDIGAERLLFWAIALHPLWWIIGIQVFVYPLVSWYLWYRSLHRPAGRPVPLILGLQIWVLYTGLWVCSMLFNLTQGTAEMGRSITAMGSILGVWLLIPVLWYAVRRLRVRLQVIVRAVCWLGCAQLVAVLLSQVYLQVTGSPPNTNSLIATLVPSLHSLPAGVFFQAKIYTVDKLEWPITVPRMVSFYYWAPLAGTMSILICMIALLEKQRLWRWLALLGSLTTLWFAASRAGQVGTALAVLTTLWFGARWGRRLLLWSLLPLGLLSPILIQNLYNYFFVYRSSSGSLRRALYAETVDAFIQSPFLGYGTQGRSNAHDLPLGSHSQLYSTLYQTGLIGSAVLIVAWIAISLALLCLVLKYFRLAPILGAWVGYSFVMVSGELAAASVTVFVFAASLGGAWNWAEDRILKAQSPWLPDFACLEPPTPWVSLHQWWRGKAPQRSSIR